MKLLFIALFIALGYSFSQAPCDPGLAQVGTLCLNETELQRCGDNLATLDGSATNNTSITNECTPYLEGGEQAYNFNISFTNGFQPDLECLDLEIKFGNTTLANGTDIFDEWQYDENTGEIHFNVSHETFEDPNGECEFQEFPDAFIWTCKMQLIISMGGEEQLTYNFEIQVTMARDANASANAQNDTLQVSVIKNVVDGYCCKNELQIETALRFCTNLQCNETLASPLQVQRGQTFIVEHYITSPEFQHYYLEGIQVKLGPYFAEIISENGDNPGSYIWELKGNIAMNNLTVEAISKIINDAPVRRFLQEAIRDDYKLKGTEQMSILSEDDIQNQEQEPKIVIVKEKEEGEGIDKVMIFAIAGVVFLSLVVIVGAVLYNRKQRRQLEQAKKEDEARYTDSNIDVTMQKK